MVEGSRYCSVCGKEKESRFIPYINKSFYIDCVCEERLKAENTEKKRKKAIECYINLRTKRSGVLKKEQSASLETLTVDINNKKAVEGARYITELLLSDEEQPRNGLVLYGNRGSGKTYIAAAVINELNRRQPFSESVLSTIIREQENGYINDVGVSVSSACRFIKQGDLVGLAGRYNYRDDTEPIDEFKKAKTLLVIDDVGTGYGDLQKIQSVLFSVLDYRYSEGLATIITTNLSREALQSYLGERTYDRLRACCYFIPLTAPQSRRE